jgi:hypothetical protein
VRERVIFRKILDELSDYQAAHVVTLYDTLSGWIRFATEERHIWPAKAV